MSKVITGSIATVAMLTTITAYSFFRENQTNEQHLTDYASQVEQLLAHVEENTLLRLQYESRIEQLKSEQIQSRNRIKALDAELIVTREKINPDFEQIEKEIRARVSQQYRNQDQPNQAPSAASLVSQLALLNPQEAMAVMSVQAQYGGFIDLLDLSPERRESISRALIDVTLGQGQARQDLLTQELAPGEMRSQLMEIMGPQATREALSYELNDQELAVFDEFQQNRTRAFGGAVGGRGAFRALRGPGGSGLRQQDGAILINPNPGDNTAPARRIITR